MKTDFLSFIMISRKILLFLACSRKDCCNFCILGSLSNEAFPVKIGCCNREICNSLWCVKFLRVPNSNFLFDTWTWIIITNLDWNTNQCLCLCLLFRKTVSRSKKRFESTASPKSSFDVKADSNFFWNFRFVCWINCLFLQNKSLTCILYITIFFKIMDLELSWQNTRTWITTRVTSLLSKEFIFGKIFRHFFSKSYKKENVL